MKKILQLNASNCLEFHPVSGRLQFWENEVAKHYITSAGNNGITPGRVLKVYLLKINWRTGAILASGRGWEATIPAVDFVLAVYRSRRAYYETKNFTTAIAAFRDELVKEHIHFTEEV